MCDSLFKKAISDKMNDGKMPPDALVWKNIDAALAEKRAEKRKRRGVVLVILFSLVTMGILHLFDKQKESEINTEKEKIAATNIGHEKVLETEKNEIIVAVAGDDREINRIAFADSPLPLKEGTSQEVQNVVFQNSKLDNLSLKLQSQQSPSQNKNSKDSLLRNQQSNENKKYFPQSQIEEERTTVENLKSKTITVFPKLSLIQSFLIVEKNIPQLPLIHSQKGAQIKPISKRKKFAATAGFESNKLAYCFDEKANHLAAKVEAEYRMTPRFAVGIGAGFYQIDYQFEVDEMIHLEAFGNTDKYPEFYNFRRAVKTIESDLTYFAGSISATFYQPISKNWSTSISASQDLIFHQKQEIHYRFFTGEKNVKIENQSTDLEIGMTGFSLGIHRSLGERLTAGFQLNRYITARTIGLERQYYHGFGGGMNLGFSF